jgi:hypothetical protein
MLDVLQALTLILVVLAMVPALAHALELPGKLRLTKDAYVAVQPICHPGFTIAGMAEPVAIIFTIILLVLTPRGSGVAARAKPIQWTGRACVTAGSIRTWRGRDLQP